jgi:hypothetical protein
MPVLNESRFDFRDVGNLQDPLGRFSAETGLASTALGDIAQRGIFTEDEISNILRGTNRERALRRRAVRGRLRRSYQRRLGSRAGGAAELTFANRVLAPQFAEQLAQRRRLRERSAASRFPAILERHRVEQARVDAFLRSQQQEREGETGFLPYVQAGASIADAIIPG